MENEKWKNTLYNGSEQFCNLLLFKYFFYTKIYIIKNINIKNILFQLFTKFRPANF
jgi:hypothetical protein